jgi:hypothetical protein
MAAWPPLRVDKRSLFHRIAHHVRRKAFLSFANQDVETTTDDASFFFIISVHHTAAY